MSGRRCAFVRTLVFVLAGLVLLVPTPGGAQTFRGGVDAVAVDVLVTSRGRPVTGLTAADFVVRDNGVPQAVDAVLVDDVPITLLLVLDTSGSVAGPPLTQLRAAVDSAVATLRPADRVGLVTFSDKLRMVLEPPAPVGELLTALQAVQAGGATALYDAAYAALIQREQTVGRVLMLVFSDGDDTASWLDPREVLSTAQRSDVVVYGVTLDRGRGDRWQDSPEPAFVRRWFLTEPHLLGRHFLSRLVEDTGGTVFVADEIRRLTAAFSEVVDEFRSRYLLTYSPEGVDTDGWHQLEVDVEGRGRRVQARRGYLR
jgi:Ca-activated chloride channel family protein